VFFFFLQYNCKTMEAKTPQQIVHLRKVAQSHTLVATLHDARRQAKLAKYRLNRYCREHRCSYKECGSSKTIPHEYLVMARQSNRLKRIEAMVSNNLKIGEVKLHLEYPITVTIDEHGEELTKLWSSTKDLGRSGFQFLGQQVKSLSEELVQAKLERDKAIADFENLQKLYAELSRNSLIESEALLKQLKEEKTHKNYYVHLSQKLSQKLEQVPAIVASFNDTASTTSSTSSGRGSKVQPSQPTDNYYQPISNTKIADHPSSSKPLPMVQKTQVASETKRYSQVASESYSGSDNQNQSSTEQPWTVVGPQGAQANPRLSGQQKPPVKQGVLSGKKDNPYPTNPYSTGLPGSTRRVDGSKGSRKATNKSNQSDWRK